MMKRIATTILFLASTRLLHQPSSGGLTLAAASRMSDEYERSRSTHRFPPRTRKDLSAPSQKVSKSGVLGVIGYAVEIPCQVTPLSNTDAPHLILWYKDIFGTPIYSFDMRSDLSGRHWMDTRILGNRASFHIEKTDFETRNGTSIYKSFLRIDKLRKSDAGPYRCRVDFKEAPTRNVKVKLNLIELPSSPVLLDKEGAKMSSSPKSPHLSSPMRINATLEVTCETKGGDPLPELTWWRQSSSSQQRGQPVEPNKVQLNAHTYTTDGTRVRSALKLEHLQREDFGVELGCVASNTELVDPQESVLKINMLLPPVRARIEREWSYFLAEKTYNVSCQIHGSNPSAYAKVKIGNRELKLLDDQDKDAPEHHQSTMIRVSFVPTIDEHNEFLSCRGENPHLATNNAVEDQWKIAVQYVPQTSLSLLDYPAHRVELNTGDQLKLKCLVDANPKANAIHWRQDGVALSEGPDLRMVTSSPSERQTSSILVLDRVQADKTSGNYTCVGENLLGRGSSGALDVRVKFRPKCQRSGSVLHYVKLGEVLDLPCVVGAFPREDTRFAWTFFHMLDVDFKSVKYLTGVPNVSDPLTNILRFQLNSTDDYGTLHCTASNEAGEQITPCIFEIKPKGGPQVESCQVVATGLHWVRLHCLINSPYEQLLHEGSDQGTRVKIVAFQDAPEAGLEAGVEGPRRQQRPPLGPGNRSVLVESFVLTSVQSSTLEQTGLRDLRKADVTLSGLSSGSRYRLQVTAFNSLSEAESQGRRPASPPPFEIAVTTLKDPDPIILEPSADTTQELPPGVEGDRRPWSAEDSSLPLDVVMVVEVEASTMPSKIMISPGPVETGTEAHQPLLIPINDPIRLLPIIGVLAIVVIVLILIAVMIVVIMRSRSYTNGDPNAKTHIGFNRSLDFDIDGVPIRGDSMDKAIRKNLESLNKVDSYEQLNNVRFEGFSSLERRRSNTNNSNASTTSSSNQGGGSLSNRKLNLLIEVPQKSSSPSNDNNSRRPRSQSLLEAELDFSSLTGSGIVTAYVHEVPVGPLCIIEDDSRDHHRYHLSGKQQALVQSGEDHFPFREAIQAPISVNRIEQLTILTTHVSPAHRQSLKKEVTFAPLVQEMDPDELNAIQSSLEDSSSKSDVGEPDSSDEDRSKKSASRHKKVERKSTGGEGERSSDSTLESECLL